MNINTLRPRQNGHHFTDDIFKHIFLNGNVWISINISLRFVPMRPIDNIPALVRIMAWRRPGDKPLSEPMMVSLLTHICVTRPQWVNGFIEAPRQWDSKVWKLTHCGLVTAYSDIDLGQPRLTIPSHYLNQYRLIINGFCGILMTAISQEILMISTC